MVCFEPELDRIRFAFRLLQTLTFYLICPQPRGSLHCLMEGSYITSLSALTHLNPWFFQISSLDSHLFQLWLFHSPILLSLSFPFCLISLQKKEKAIKSLPNFIYALLALSHPTNSSCLWAKYLKYPHSEIQKKYQWKGWTKWSLRTLLEKSSMTSYEVNNIKKNPI